MSVRFSDPVIDWLNTHEYGELPLDHAAAFNFGEDSVSFNSNAVDLIRKLNETFYYYPPLNKQSDSSSGIQIDIYCIKNKYHKSGVQLPSFLNADKSDPSDIRIGKDGFGHFKTDEIECFWRPDDILVSVPQKTDEPVRVLLCEHEPDEQIEENKKRIKIKGKKKFPKDIDDVTDLIKILLIRKLGKYCVHGATLSIEGQGVLLTGHSGAGKTTTALAAVRQGFDMLTDELSLISIRPDGKPVLQGLMVPPSIVGGAECLDDLETTIKGPERGDKYPYLSSENVFKARPDDFAVPRTLIFLERSKKQTDDHKINEISWDKALMLMMEQVLDFDCPFRLKDRFNAVTSLVSECRIYSLTLGTDLESLPGVIRSCMEA